MEDRVSRVGGAQHSKCVSKHSVSGDELLSLEDYEQLPTRLDNRTFHLQSGTSSDVELPPSSFLWSIAGSFLDVFIY